MSAHRLPIFGLPTRSSRGKAGFFKQTPLVAAEPETLQLISQWKLEDNSWADEVGSNPLQQDDLVNVVAGYEGMAAEFAASDFDPNLSIGKLFTASGAVPYMNQSEWEIELYVWFSTVTGNSGQTIACYAEVTTYYGAEWNLYLQESTNGANSRIRLNSLASAMVTAQTWHFLRFGLEYVEQQGQTAARYYLSVNGAPEIAETIPMSNLQVVPATASLFLGDCNLFSFGYPKAGMRIDEVKLRQQLLPAEVLSTVAYWSLDTTDWTSTPASLVLSESGTIMLAAGVVNSAAAFAAGSKLFTTDETFRIRFRDSWEVELKLWFDDLSSFDTNNSEAGIFECHDPEAQHFNLRLEPEYSYDENSETFIIINYRLRCTADGQNFEISGLGAEIWYTVRFGRRHRIQKAFFEVDGTEFTQDNPYPASSQTDEALFTLGGDGLDGWASPAMSGMRIDEVIVKAVV